MTRRALVLRNEAGDLHPDLWAAQPHFMEFFVDDGTGFVSGATPTAERVKGSPVFAGQSYGITHDSGLTTERVASVQAQFEVQRSGTYKVYATGTWLGGNASVLKAEIFKTPIATGIAAVISDAAASPGGSIRCEGKMQATAAQESFQITPARLRGLVKGDLIDLRVTGSVGTVTIKQLRLVLEQCEDADPPDLQ